MKILVIGGSGFISSRLVRMLVQRGHAVTAFTRGKSAVDPELLTRASWVHGDRDSPGDLESLGRGATYDVVYDMVAYKAPQSQEAARVFRGRVGRFIHCSTVSVYMVAERVQCPVTEDQDQGPLMEYFPRNPFGMDYGIKKRDCERVLWSAHDERLFPVSMLRPIYVPGPGDPASRDWFWIERILDGGPLLVPGSGDIAFQQVFVDDVAGMFAELPERPQSVGKAYNIAGEEIFSLNEYLHVLGELVGREVRLVHLDQKTFDALDFSTSPQGDVFTFNVRRTAVVSLDRIKRDLDYRPTPFRDYMRRTIEWWTDVPRPHSNGYARRAEELETIRRLTA
jgi:nucleoside-diphosphate-sugar epimerase